MKEIKRMKNQIRMIAELTNKKTAVKVKKGMTPEELSNDKLDMIR
jgi:hypothetical protein